MESPESISYALKIAGGHTQGGVRPMLYKNLTVKELYASISDEEVIYSMFVRGLNLDNDRLAVSAMEELIVRGFTDTVIHGLQEASKRGDIKVKSTTATMIACSLSESCRGINPFLREFGKFLFKAKGPDPFKKFVEGEGREEERKTFQDGKKPCLSDRRSARYFGIGDKVVCFICPGKGRFKTGFMTGKVIDSCSYRGSTVYVCMDEKYHTGDHCEGHGFSVYMRKPEIMHEWEFEYFKNHPDHLTIWCNKSDYPTYGLQEAFAELLSMSQKSS